MNQWNPNDQALLVEESLYFTGNGYVGVRGNFEEGVPTAFPTIRGTYLNGFYDTVNLEYGESAHGFPMTAQKLINVFDAQTISLEVDGDRFSVDAGLVLSLDRTLSVQEGVVTRKVDWISPKGHRLMITIRRMASFSCPELFLVDYRVISDNYTGTIRIRSTIEGDVSNFVDEKDPRVGSNTEKLLHVTSSARREGIAVMEGATNRSGLSMAVAVIHDVEMDYTLQQSRIEGAFVTRLSPGEELAFTKYIVYTDSLRHAHVVETAIDLAGKALTMGKEHWLDAQKAYLDKFWETADVEITGEEGIDEVLRFNMYQLLASAGRDAHSNISAKGLSGEGYEGHYFWDTEIYMIPFFLLTNPDLAKNLLQFRYAKLPEARVEAQNLGHKKGAKIPWRTIAGSECSGYFPGGSAQYHINADVAYSNIQYYLYTGDLEYLSRYGFEVLYETARLWIETGHYDEGGKFRIDGVTGPDEYTAMVNNNYYTNAMAQYHLEWTVKLAHILETDCKEAWMDLVSRIGINQEELEMMARAGQGMYLPYSQELGIHLQDDSFLFKKEWDFAGIPKEKYPLVLHFHPLTIYRHKVLKQADTVLAHMLLDQASEDVLRRSYSYYEPLTTHDSSLSPCVHSMMAARLNDPEKAYLYFKQTLRLDLDNLHGNTKDGLHIANAGGSYMTIVYGFAGLRIKEDGLHFRPTKPHQWSRVRFRIRYREALVQLTIGERFTIDTDRPLDLFVNERPYHVENHLEV